MTYIPPSDCSCGEMAAELQGNSQRNCSGIAGELAEEIAGLRITNRESHFSDTNPKNRMLQRDAGAAITLASGPSWGAWRDRIRRGGADHVGATRQLAAQRSIEVAEFGLGMGEREANTGEDVGFSLVHQCRRGHTRSEPGTGRADFAGERRYRIRSSGTAMLTARRDNERGNSDRRPYQRRRSNVKPKHNP
jgi:hypothetical protein